MNIRKKLCNKVQSFYDRTGNNIEPREIHINAEVERSMLEELDTLVYRPSKREAISKDGIRTHLPNILGLKAVYGASKFKVV
jgi:hypothetical protein